MPEIPGHLKTLSLANLRLVDNGKIEITFNMLLRTILQDITDRPREKAKRTLTLTVEAVPVIDPESGELLNTAIQFLLTPKVPKKKTQDYLMAPMSDNVVAFSPMSPEDPRQGDFSHKFEQSADGPVEER